ncbi:Nif11-like leader peptide family RiPP precursor [Desulforamulus aeronauticus]|uniref:Nif11-like leader peptide domain-containing protein n=1 Tax=Desulforamulus aeronauticus DSM 10349 TaxID=1121421 RepID=A0A1M6NVB4_9FIRM|nr:Nif11-like leader peptide family RiPP precursor [Desulforamulus aeronauticus]SHJ99581.1 nif11-like leader peptide domain-containing protein [Desulforamulus aeronauticus DSM 10349]
MATNFEQLKAKIDADPSLAEKLFELESPEEAQSFLKGEGLEFTLEELATFANEVNKLSETGELSDEALEGVAGGSATATAAAVATLASVTDDMTGGHVRRAISSGVRSVARRVFRGW